jgi:signal transduction histidine kinase
VFIGTHASVGVDSAMYNNFRELASYVRETGNSESFDYSMTIGGKEVWFTSVLSLHEDGESIVSVSRPITERKQAEDALRVSEKNARLVAEVANLYLDLMSHDLINKFQAMRIGIELLQLSSIPHDALRTIDEISNSISNSTDLINKVRSTENLFELEMRKVCLIEALNETVERFREIDRNVDIELNSDIQEADIIADACLNIIFTNMLENAVKHNPKEKKKIWISLTDFEKGFELSFADNGPGISDEMKSVIFDPTYRYGGVGIHQARSILTKYSGHISVNDRVSGSISEGTEFKIWIPSASQ